MRKTTIGIPTYNRTKYVLSRLKDLERMGYFNNHKFEIIVHDNDSENKNHCKRIKILQKRVKNLILLESIPNIGMINACWKILKASTGDWIVFLGDDDPILLKAKSYLKILKQAKNSDHIMFKSKLVRNGKIQDFPWWPKMPKGYYSPVKLAAKLGFVTMFAHLGAHSFKKFKNINSRWLKSHESNMIYGHCIMALNNYKKTFYPGVALTAWTEGNERMSGKLNLFRQLELRNMLKYPKTKKIKEFISERPIDVLEIGHFPFDHHLTDPSVEIVNIMENQKIGKRIILKAVHAQKLENNGPIFIGESKFIKEKISYSAIFLEKCKLSSVNWQKLNSPICFEIEQDANTLNIYYILIKLQISGDVFYNNNKSKNKTTEIAPFFYLLHSSGGIGLFTYLCLFNRIIISTILYGFDSSLDRTFLNFYERPRQGIYKVINDIEKSIRKTNKAFFGAKYKSLNGLFSFIKKWRNSSKSFAGMRIVEVEQRKY